MVEVNHRHKKHRQTGDSITFNLCKPLQMPHTPQSRRYCGTIHFPTDHTQWADAAHCINTDPYTRFFICQPEQCPDTGKLHVQF